MAIFEQALEAVSFFKAGTVIVHNEFVPHGSEIEAMARRFLYELVLIQSIVPLSPYVTDFRARCYYQVTRSA